MLKIILGPTLEADFRKEGPGDEETEDYDES